MPKITLRYFSIVGRAQPLRHALAAAGTPFEDVQVTLAEWPTYRDDPSFAGAFAALPTLTWGDVTLVETLPIATFLAKRLGQYDGLDDATIAHLEAICSCAYIDGVSWIGQMVWADMLFPGADMAAAFPRMLARSLGKLARLDAVVPRSAWFGGNVPKMADFFAVEAFEAHRHVLGHARDPALRARFPRLSALTDRVSSLPAVARQKRPERFSARPDEPQVLERLRAVDVSPLGL